MANKGAQTAVLDGQIMHDAALPSTRYSVGTNTSPAPSHPPPVHSNNNQPYNIHQRIRQHQGQGGRISHSPSIRQSWLFPTNRASPSTALPETTSVMTLNHRPHSIRTDPSSSSTAASSATAQSVPPSVALNKRERRNFSGSARSRLTKIDRLSKMMLNPNAPALNSLDSQPPAFPSPAPLQRARLSLQPQTITVVDPSLPLSPSSLADSHFHGGLQSSNASLHSSVATHVPHTSGNTSYPRHIVMQSTTLQRSTEDTDNNTSGGSLSSSLPSATAFALGVEASHIADSPTQANTEKANRHASMPLPRPGWRLYDLPDVEESEVQLEDGEGPSSGGGDKRNSFQYSMSNASSMTNLDSYPYPYHNNVAHVRQDSSSTFYTLTPNASNVDLSIASSFTNLSSVDLSSPSTSDPASTSGLSSHIQDPSPASSAINNPTPPFKAIKNSKSPLALRRSSTISSTGSPSPSNTFPSKGSFPKLSLSSNATHNTKTLTQERQKIILEILQTERSYVDGLVILQTLFYEPLNAPYATNNNSGMNTTTSTSFGNIHGLSAGIGAGAGTGGTQSSLNTSTYASSTVGSSSTLAASAAPLLTKKSVAEIFSNFSEILQINTLLLTQLETRICGATFSTGWESDDEDEESNENTHHGQHKDGSRGSQERRGAEQMPSQVLVTVGGQGGEQEQLLVLDTDWLIGDIFIEIAPFLKMYSNYVKTYTSALTHINDCMNRNDRFTEFLKATAKKPECRNLDFQAYLMLPVQRIPRYRMLLESLLRHTPDDHPDHRKLQTAFESMEQTANFVNETIRQHEMFGEMLDLQSRITGFSEPLVVPGRVLLKRGNVWKVCRRNVQPRMIILLSDCILWTSPGMNPLDGTLTFHRKVGLENCTVIGAEDPDPTKNAFQIISPEKSSQVYVDTPKEKEDWMVAIRRATQEYLSAKRTLKISITPMQSISAAATSFGANLLRRDNGLWSPSPFGGGSDSRSNTFISSPTSASPESQNSATGAWSSLGSGYYQAGPGAATAGTAQKSQQQPLHVVENYNAPVWVPDHSAMRCMICTEEFGTIFRRKHHCRACGKVVCHSCSTRTILIKSAQSEKVGRACDDCIDTMFPEEADTTANQALAPVPEPVSGGRGTHGDPHRRANSQSLDGVLVRPEDYSQEYGVQSGATGLVRGFVEAGLNRMKSRHGQVESTAAESNARENTRESNRRSDSHFASANDNSVKECGLCRTEFSMFKWRNICSKCRRVVCSDCLTKKQIDQLFLLGLQAESEGLERESEITAGQMSHGRQPSDAQELSRPGLSQNVSESAVETSRQSDIAGSLNTRRSQSFNQGDGGVANNGSGGYGSFGHGWRAIKGNTDSGHGHAEKLCDPCYLGLSDDHIKVLETGGGWHYYQATLGKHQAPALVAALAMSAMTLGEDGDNEEGSADGAAKLAPNKSETGIALRRAG